MNSVAKRIVALLIILLSFVGECWAQIPTTQGTEFYISFMRNSNINDPSIITLSVAISGKESCSGTITNPNTGYLQSFDYTAGDVKKINIPFDEVYNYESGVVQNRGIILRTTDTVSVYVSNYVRSSFDIAGVLPIQALGCMYVIQTYSYGKMQSTESEFVVVATQNNTRIHITPSATSANVGITAGQSYVVTLNAGQTYQLAADVDLSGTQIQTEDDKPIAVFAGNAAAQVPIGVTFTDHLVEQQLPVSIWGRQFALMMSLGRNVDYVRITALYNNTVVTMNGKNIATLSAGQTYEYKLLAPGFLETSYPVAVYQYLVGQNAATTLTGDPSMILVSPLEQQITDISFLTYQTDATNYHLLNAVTMTENVANIYLDSLPMKDNFVRMPNNVNLSYMRREISAGVHHLWSESEQGIIAYVYGLGTSESYGYAIGSTVRPLDITLYANDVEDYRLDVERHIFCPTKPIELKADVTCPYTELIWDFGDGTIGKGSKVSHLYGKEGKYEVTLSVEGAAMADTSRSTKKTMHLQIGNVFTLRTIGDTLICEDNDVQIGVEVEGEPAGDLSYAWSHNLPDTAYHWVRQTKTEHYQVVVSESVCGYEQTATIQVAVYEKNTPMPILGDSSICFTDTATLRVDVPDDVVWNIGEHTHTIKVAPLRNTTYTVTPTDNNTCFIPGTITVRVSLVDTVYSSVTICEGDVYNFRGHLVSEEGIYTDTVFHRNGCDSILYYLDVTVLPVYRDTIVGDICSGDVYDFYGKPLSVGGTYYDTLYYASGCDSLITTLNLTVHRVFRTNYVDEFCEGTQYSFRNKIYEEEGYYVDSLISAYGCDSIITLQLKFIDVPQDIAGRWGDSVTICRPNVLTLDVGDANWYSVQWQDGSRGSNYLVYESGLYSATVTHACGKYEDSVHVYVRDCEIQMWIPNAFTPNGDGRNDIFLVEGRNIEMFEIHIYNRWGREVYSSCNMEEGWNGTVDGEPCSQGVYTYTIKFRTNFEMDTRERKGTFMLY